MLRKQIETSNVASSKGTPVENSETLNALLVGPVRSNSLERINSVCPGTVSIEFHDKFTSPDVRAQVTKVTPLKREGNPVDVARLVT
ncbi:MAG: hypothetical protein KTR33_08335 [Gammaproteobacteria bacterium]|nr:hypothetical protein [Gammaproteobacteria bacterium]